MFEVLDLLCLPVGAAPVGFAMFRARKYKAPRLRTAFFELVTVLLAVAVWFTARTANYLAGPPDGDLYAQTWGFQAIVFVLVYLPWAMLTAGALLLAQSLFLTRRRGHAL